MKKHITLDRIIDDISTCMAFKKELTQELLFSFMKKFIADNGSFFDAKKTKSYKAMRSRLNELWQYREWEDMSSEQAFLYGQLFGCVRLCEYREQSHQDIAWTNYLLSKYEDSKLFYIVKRNPGIRHKDLAQEIGLTAGRLSQMMDEEDTKDLIVSRVMGREKHYFLGAKGEELLQKLEAQKREAEKENRQKGKAETACAEFFEGIFVRQIAESANVNIPPSLVMPKAAFAMQRRLEDAFKMEEKIFGINKTNYLNLKNEFAMEKSMEEEEECLTEENSCCAQWTSPLRNGSMRFSAE